MINNVREGLNNFEMYKHLELLTGTKFDEIEYENHELIQYLIENEYIYKTTKYEEEWDKQRERFYYFADLLNPQTFSDWSKIINFINTRFHSEAYVKEYIQRGIIDIKNIISCGDDVLNLLISSGCDPELAFEFAFVYSSGRMSWEVTHNQFCFAFVIKYHTLLSELHLPEWLWDFGMNNEFMRFGNYGKRVLEYKCKLAWYKINYPEKYKLGIITRGFEHKDIVFNKYSVDRLGYEFIG